MYRPGRNPKSEGIGTDGVAFKRGLKASNIINDQRIPTPYNEEFKVEKRKASLPKVENLPKLPNQVII